MKLSEKNFNYLFQAALSDGKQYELFRQIFKGFEAVIDDEYTTTESLMQELNKIATSADSDFENLYKAGEVDYVSIDFHREEMFVSMSGDQAPYADEMDYEEDEDEYDFDAIGTWSINLKTKEVDFSVALER